MGEQKLFPAVVRKAFFAAGQREQRTDTALWETFEGVNLKWP